MSRTARKTLASLSLANLSMLSVWKSLNSPNLNPYYLPLGIPLRSALAALMLAAILVLVFWLAFTVLERSQSVSLSANLERVFLLSLIIPANGFRDRISGLNLPNLTHHLGKGVLLVLAVIALFVAVAVLLKWHHLATRIAFALALVTSLYCLVTVSQVSGFLWQLQHLENQPPRERLAVPDPKPTVRVIWMVFDEMDQRLAFSKRPAELRLPNFERLKVESVYAENAISACRDTQEAIPSLTTGKIVEEVRPEGADELMLRYSGNQQFVPWSSQATVFSTARALGFHTAAIGWYHPYCRVIGHDLDQCMWVPLAFPSNKNGLLSCLSHEFQEILPVVAQSQRYRDHLDRYLRIKQAAKTVMLDRGYQFVLVHWPIPHMPFIYDRQKEKYQWVIPWDGYLGNLALADRVLGEVRADLESIGSWDAGAIIVTSDHFWRDSRLFDSKEDSRVPFIVKMPGKNTGVRYERAFSTIVTRALLEEIMKGSIATPQDVCAWLDRSGRGLTQRWASGRIN